MRKSFPRRNWLASFFAAPRLQTAPRKRAWSCETLERRTLLSTFVINGTINPDNWTISADAGTITVNGVTTVQANITDVQVNGPSGSDSSDSLFVTHTTIPIVFNGGNGDDHFFAGDGTMSQEAQSTLTFNGGVGNDDGQCRNDTYATSNNYAFAGNSIGWGSGTMVWDSGVEFMFLTEGTGDSNVSIGSLSNNVNITVSGNTGSDAVTVAMGGSTGTTVSFTGGNGAGTDSLSITDIASAPTYTITAGSVARTGRTVSYTGLESLQLQGAASTANTFNVSGTNAAMSMTLIGGSASDTFNLTAAQYGSTTLTGATGTLDAMSIDDRTLAAGIFRANIDVATFNRDRGTAASFQTYNLSYTGLEKWTYDANNTTTEINVHGVSSSIPAGQQATIICGSGADIVTLFPHDAGGNLTMNGALGVFGGASTTDQLVVDDTGSTHGINYSFSNPSGASTQNIFGMGAAGFGAFNDVESITIKGGNGEDTFALNTWQSGAALIVNSGGGYDTFDISPTAHNLPAAITSMSFFSYDGGTGDDHFDVVNYDNTSAWTITRTSTQLSYSAPSTGYFLVINLSHIGYLYASGGTVADAYLIKSTPADNMNNDLYGAGGSDTYTFGNAGLTSGIGSYVNVNGFGGTDSIVIDDSADTVGRSFHINSGFINAVPGDTLFPAAGGDIYGIVVPDSVTGTITIKLGSGADTVNFAPVATGHGTYGIQGNSPTSGSGDKINFAFAGVTSPVLTPQGTGNGTYTFGNRATMSYTGIETTTIDSVAPTFVGGNYSYDTVNGSSIDLQYSENVAPGLYNTYFDLYNSTTGQSIPYGIWAYTYNSGTNTVHYTFPGLPGGVLPAGSYQTSSSRVTDAAGNALTGSVLYNFIWTGGTAGPDTFRIAVNPAGTMTQVYQNNDVTPAFTANYSSLNQIFIAGGEDDDTFVVDTSNGNPYAISGITFDGGNGTDTLNVRVTDLVDTVSFDNGALVIDGGPIAHSNFENFSYSGADYYVALAVNAGTVALSGAPHFESLSIADGAAVTVEAGTESVVIARSLFMTSAARLDLADNDLILDYSGPTSPAAGIEALTAVGFNSGDWLGNGITSSTAAGDAAGGQFMLGVAENTNLIVPFGDGNTGPQFDGQNIDDTAVLVKYTHRADIDLDGVITSNDAAVFNGQYTEGAPAVWATGDLDYDGIYTSNDAAFFNGFYDESLPPV